MFLAQREQLTTIAAAKRMPVMYWSREFAEAGGLISYGSGITWMYREAGRYCGKILKGAKPVDMPIVQPSTFDTVINGKTAEALGIKMPRIVLYNAEVIR
jgi:putative ABC transport system substrate-binding protein